MTIYSGMLNPGCGHSLLPTRELFHTYFDQTPHSCVCGIPVDAWDLVRGCFVGAGATFSLLAPIGGKSSISTLTLKLGELFHLDLRTLDIEPTDIVTMVNFTGISEVAQEGDDFSSIFPAMLFGNAVPTRSVLQHEMTIFPAPVGPTPPVEGTFNLYVHFVEEQREIHRALLLDSIRSHGEGDYRRSILNAHTAADTALEDTIRRQLDALTPSNLQGDLDLGFRGKIQSLASARYLGGLPELSPTLIRLLYDLNARRNRIAHPSKKPKQLTQEIAADLLTAALFLVELAESDFGLAS